MSNFDFVFCLNESSQPLLKRSRKGESDPTTSLRYRAMKPNNCLTEEKTNNSTSMHESQLEFSQKI